MTSVIMFIARREFSARLKTGAGLTITFTLVGGSSFYLFILHPYFIIGEATLRPFFKFMPLLLTLIAPALTMGLIADERESGRLEHLLSLPISYPSLLFGKLLGVWFLLFLSIACSLISPLMIGQYSDLDWGPVWSGYLGMILTGSLYLCIGLWATCRVSTTLTAWLLTFMLCFTLYLIGHTAVFLPPSWGEWAQALSVHFRLERFIRGVIDIRDVLFFGGACALWFSFAVSRFRKEVIS